MKGATYIVFYNESKQAAFVTNYVFTFSFMQTGFILALASLNGREMHADSDGLMTKLFSGIYTDFNMFWFVDIGAVILSTMQINAVFPVVEWFGYYGMRHASRMWDQKKFWPNDLKKTHCLTIESLCRTYHGPTFIAHFKYAFVAMIIYVTLMYSIVMPVLIPIAWLAFLIFYASESLFLHYSYQKPFTFDILITKETL
jgi:hypothetical protein